MKQETNKSARKRPPATTVEGRENELIAKAVDLAEKRIESGQASDSLILHYLKLGTTKIQLEKEKLEAEVELAKSKSDSIKQQARSEELYAEAIKAMRIYSGQGEDEDYVED